MNLSHIFLPFVTALPPNSANDLYTDTISSDDDVLANVIQK